MSFALLLETLDDLKQKDLRRFKWWLEKGVLDSCKPIPPSRLEDTDQEDIVDVMIKNYGEAGAVDVTLETLKKMENNYAAEKLKNKYAAGGNTAAASTSAPAAPPAAAAAPPAAAAAPPATVTAQPNSVLIVPTVTGGTSGTWNITVNNS